MSAQFPSRPSASSKCEGVGVFVVLGVKAAVHQFELPEDAVLLPFEHGERDRVRIAGLHEPVLLDGTFDSVTP